MFVIARQRPLKYHFTYDEKSRGPEVEYGFDPKKESANRIKHGVNFEQAAEALGDPNALQRYDDAHSTLDEDRWQTIGQSKSGILFVVTSEKRGKIARIVSARRATEPEKALYRRQKSRR